MPSTTPDRANLSAVLVASLLGLSLGCRTTPEAQPREAAPPEVTRELEEPTPAVPPVEPGASGERWESLDQHQRFASVQLRGSMDSMASGVGDIYVEGDHAVLDLVVYRMEAGTHPVRFVNECSEGAVDLSLCLADGIGYVGSVIVGDATARAEIPILRHPNEVLGSMLAVYGMAAGDIGDVSDACKVLACGVVEPAVRSGTR